MFLTVPNLITIFRITLVPFMFVCFYMPVGLHGLISAFIFLLAAISDWVDGYLARKLRQTSSFGEFLDPVADKLIVVIAIILICSTGKYNDYFISLPASVIICRELSISSLREWMVKIGKGNLLKVNKISKYKTLLQMASIFGLLVSGRGAPGVYSLISYYIFCLASLFTIVSMFIYFKIVWKEMSQF